MNSTDAASPVVIACLTACSTEGVRTSAETCLRCASTPMTPRIARLAKITRPDSSSSISGSGSRSKTSRAIGGSVARSESPGTRLVRSSSGFSRSEIAVTATATAATAANATQVPLPPEPAAIRLAISMPAASGHTIRLSLSQNAKLMLTPADSRERITC